MSFVTMNLNSLAKNPAKSMQWFRPSRAGFAAKIRVFLAYFAAVVLLQWHANAFLSELGSTADEPAHYITGLMVRDYLAHAALILQPPMAFARNYYLHYPKVALGHWPPFFYVVQAAWTLLFSPSVISVMLLMAALTSVLATAVCQALREFTSWIVAFCAGLLFISLPVVEEFSQMLMAEMLVALLVFLAVLSYGQFLQSQRWQPAAWFGLWCSLALLTKGTGIQLALVPPMALLLTRRWHWLRRFTFWLPAIIVCALAVPWYLWVPGAQHESVARFGGLQVATNRNWQTPLVWFQMVGPVVAVAACVGVFVYRRKSDIYIAAIASLLGTFVVRLFIGAFEERHLVGNLPVLIVFAAVGVDWVMARSKSQVWVRSVAALALVALVTFNVRATPHKRQYGFRETALSILAHPEFNKSVILVCGAAQGEGMLISEIAMHETRPGHVVLRATKMLESVDWMGWDPKPYFHDADSMLQSLEAIPVGIVVIDPDGQSTPHGKMLLAGILAHPEKWQPILPQESGILVFRLIGHEGKPVGRIQIQMRSGLYGKFSD